MATKPNPRPWTGKKASQGFAPSTFVNQELSKQQREHLKSIQVDYDSLETIVCDLLDSGYNIKLSVDARNNCYAAWLLPANTESPNQGYILSGRGSTALKALKQVWYLHSVVYDKDWGSGHGVAGGEIDD